ncbi:MAG: SRPBCC family protein [Caulobacteraceae bacterium]
MGFRIEHRTGVAVPAPVVWDVLRDLDAWPSWNPAYARAKGRLGIGERLELTERAGGVERALVARVVDWVPNEQILWRASAAGGLAKRLRFIEIEALSEAGCILANGEVFDGLLAKSTFGPSRRALSDAYAAMSEAVKTRAEATWTAMSAAERAEILKNSPPPAPKAEPLPKMELPKPMKGYFGRR